MGESWHCSASSGRRWARSPSMFHPADHPTTADLTAGMVYSHLPVQQLVRQIAKGNDQSARRVYARVPFDTKDAVRFQNCRVYADDIGQPAMSLEVAERVSSNTSVGTTIVRELDNLEQAQKGWELCKEAQDRLGEVWVLHRSMFPANN